MTIILSLETTSKQRSLCLLYRDDMFGISSVMSLDIFFSLKEVFKQANSQVSEVDVFLTTTGPGSFTGIRQGLSLFVGLKTALKDKQFLTISTLDLLTFYAREALKTKAVMVALSNGRFGYYVKRPTLPPQVLSKQEVLALKDMPVLSDELDCCVEFPKDLSKLLISCYQQKPELFSTSLNPCYVHDPSYKKSFFG
jgi:tRNA A37 threonylcarbamoyladenosine modification protein TsaB